MASNTIVCEVNRNVCSQYDLGWILFAFVES